MGGMEGMEVKVKKKEMEMEMELDGMEGMEVEFEGLEEEVVLVETDSDGCTAEESLEIFLRKTSVEKEDENRVMGASIAAGIFGLLLWGPLMSLFLGFATIYAAQKEGIVAEAVRALGDVALVAKEKALEMERKHNFFQNFVHKSQVMIDDLLKSVYGMDKEHHIFERLRTFAWSLWISAVEYNRRHQIVEGCLRAFGAVAAVAFELITDQIQNTARNQTHHRRETSSDRY